MPIHSQHSEKEGSQDRMKEKLRYHYQYHHNYLPPPQPPPPQLLQFKRLGEERREEERQKLSHTLPHAHSDLDQ